MSVQSIHCQWLRGAAFKKPEQIVQKTFRAPFSHNARRFQSSITSTTTSPHTHKSRNGDSAGQNVLEKSSPPPHSLLPTKMLLRSLLVSTISSSPFLLRSALNFLQLLTKKRYTLLDVNKNWLLHALLKKTFYEHFCAGENRREVDATIRSIKDIGFKGVILTYAREIVVDERTKQERGIGSQAMQHDASELGEKEKYADISAWKSGVLDTLDMVGEGDFLALKFTGAGETVAKALRSRQPLPPPMQEALDTICTRALQRNVRILVDAEQQSVQPAIDDTAIDLMKRYNRSEKNAVIYNTYQMYLKASTTNLNQHMQDAARDGYTLGVKVVRGAYMNSEPRHLIHDTKQNTDRAYDDSVEAMIQNRYIAQGGTSRPQSETNKPPSVAVFVASHNKASALQAVKLHQERLAQGLPTVSNIEFGQLLGMADEVSCSLLQMKDSVAQHGEAQNQGKVTGPQVYKCLSWGTLEDCLSYLLRRAVENRDAVSRTTSEAIATRKEIWRRMKGSLGLAR